MRLPSLALLVLAAACSKSTTAARPVPPQPMPQAEVRGESRGNSGSLQVLGIPPGHLPRAGLCRVWVPGRAPGRQARAGRCRTVIGLAPAGSWIVYRPYANSRMVHVHVVDGARAGRIVMIRHYDGDGKWERDEEPGSHRDDDWDDDDRQRPGNNRGRRPNN